MQPRSDLRRLALLIALLVSLFPGLVVADLLDDSEDLRTVVKSLDHLDARDVPELLSMLAVRVVVDSDHQAVVLRGRDELDTALQLLDALDKPPLVAPNVELFVHILAAQREGPSGDATLPEALRPVANQLRQTLGYQGIRLAESTFLRLRDGSDGALDGILATAEGEQQRYQLQFARARLLGFGRARAAGLLDDEAAPPEHQLRLDDLRFFLADGKTQLATDVDLREGQKAVIGKAAADGATETLILVLDVRVLD